MNVKKIISVLLAMLIVTTSFSLLPVSASALETEETKETVITESGTTGDCTFAAEIDSESVELGVINLPDDEDAPNYPEIIKFENTNNGVMVYWTAFPGAESYRLFYWNGEKWRSVGSTSELSYLHKNAENGKSYLYTVRAEDEWGDYCSDFNHDGYENVYLVKENTENELVKKSGTTGDCTWELDEDGTLTISGDGDMEDHSINDYESWGDTIKTVIINAGVTNIGNQAFANCTSLTSITIPDSVTSIGNDAFSECESLTNIVIPDSVTSIGDRAFDSCRSLTSITIPNSVTNIGESAFFFCRSLTSITIPISVTSIGDDAFEWCTSLTIITIPNSVTSIGDSAFCECTSLKSIEIPKKVTSIGDQTFYGCTNLESLTIPSNVTSIGDSAFCRCTSLNSITIPSSVKSIGEHAFGFFYNLNLNTYHGEYTKIDDFIIKGKSGSEAQRYAEENDFKFIDNDYEFEEENNLIKERGTTGDYTWVLYKDGTLTISDEATVDIYREYSSWESLKQIIKTIIINDGVTCIKPYAFFRCYNLTSIIIPNSVSRIGDYAFEGCTSLTSITIPDSVTKIGNFAFGFCENLTSITIPNGVTSIGDYAFEGCTSLTSITIPDSVTKIGDSAFSCCTSLANITIPNSVTSIGWYAFGECTNLTSITIPNSVTSIGMSAFGNCTNLTSVTIPNSVTSIGMSAFAGCKSLKSITIPSSVESIGEKAFGYCKSIDYYNGNFIYNYNSKIDGLVIKGKSGSKAQRYAEENNFKFIPTNFLWGEDNWSFNNESDNFKNITRDENTIFKDIIKQFELSDNQKTLLNTWFDNESYKDAGMCFGMTISEILVNKGIIKLSEYSLDNILNKNKINTSTQLIISIIQGIFNTNWGTKYLGNLKLSLFNPTGFKQSDFLRNIETKLTNGNNLVMIGYKEGYKDSEKNNYHAVLGYGIEEGDYPYEGKNYNRKILIADPDYLSQNELKDEACIYYNSDYTSWVCPIRSYYWNDNSDSNAEIYDVLIDADSKDSPVGSGEGESENHYIAGISIYNKGGNQQTIEQVEGTGDPELNFTGDGSGIARYYIDGGNRVELYALWNPTADYIVKYSTPSDYNMKMDYEHVTYYANVENGKSTLVKPEGSINIKGSDVNYSITMLTDDSERVTDWYALTVSGNNTDEVTLKKHESGYILSSDNLQNIEIKAEKGDVEAVKTFSTTYNSVFIYEIDENTISIKVDVDGDGTYETELSDVQNTYQIGDVNFDGEISIDDVTQIQLYLAELSDFSDEQRDIADVNGDGYITIEDATQMQLYLAELI